MNTLPKDDSSAVLEYKGPPLTLAPSNAPVTPITPMAMLSLALERGNLDVIPKLMDFQERWEKNQSVKAFNAAIAAAKVEIKPIVKNRTVAFESRRGGASTNYAYEDFAGVAAAVDPILGKYGLWYRFRTECPTPDTLKMICIIGHKDGHTEENSLIGPNDHSGNKNAMQAIGSAQTYLQRYTLKAALGLAAAHDDDAQSVSQVADQVDGDPVDVNEKISADQVVELKKMLEFKSLDLGKFLGWVAIAPACRQVRAIEEIPAAFFKSCVDKIASIGVRK